MQIRQLLFCAAALCAAGAAAPVSAQELGSPFRATDLKPGERWFTRDHGGGDQTLGHDLTIRRYTGSNKWTCNKAGTNGSKNSDKPAWKKPGSFKSQLTVCDSKLSEMPGFAKQTVH